MIVNSTCVQTNGTDACFAPSSSAGLAVGLSLFFILLVIGVGGVVFKCHKKMRTLVQFEQRGNKEKTVCAEPPQTEDDHYTSMSIEQPEGQTPIYENLTIQAGYRGAAAQHSRYAPSLVFFSYHPAPKVKAVLFYSVFVFTCLSAKYLRDHWTDLIKLSEVITGCTSKLHSFWGSTPF